MLQVGDVVIVKEDNSTPCTQWRMAKVLHLISWSDGKQRGAKLHVLSPAVKLSIVRCPLQTIISFEIINEQILPTEEPETKLNTFTETNSTCRH